ncbi:hypothetical protein [Patulibacter americanus]|uniref:hypothetical protein n=1 Tax=Patulibacter americanus TaxID=588672 RepID=UPI0003B63A10|nr:hypothetical protein [Patulibacter americanus]
MTAGDGVVRVGVEIAAPVDHVWEWLTEPALIPRWFGWEHDALEGEIDALFVDGVAKSRGLLRFGTNGAGVFRLEELGELTRLTLARRADELDPAAPFDGLDEGWTTFLQTLRLALERHPDEPRRVLQFQGPLRTAAAPPVLEALGLAGLADLAPGERYAAETAAGERLEGELWFRSPHQLGLTVDAWGDGLLVVVDQPVDDARPFGGGQLFLSSYGLDDAAFAGLFERWTRWSSTTFAR